MNLTAISINKNSKKKTSDDLKFLSIQFIYEYFVSKSCKINNINFVDYSLNINLDNLDVFNRKNRRLKINKLKIIRKYSCKNIFERRST